MPGCSTRHFSDFLRMTDENPMLKIGISRGIADNIRQDAAQKFPTLLGSLFLLAALGCNFFVRRSWSWRRFLLPEVVVWFGRIEDDDLTSFSLSLATFLAGKSSPPPLSLANNLRAGACLNFCSQARNWHLSALFLFPLSISISLHLYIPYLGNPAVDEVVPKVPNERVALGH